MLEDKGLVLVSYCGSQKWTEGLLDSCRKSFARYEILIEDLSVVVFGKWKCCKLRERPVIGFRRHRDLITLHSFLIHKDKKVALIAHSIS